MYTLEEALIVARNCLKTLREDLDRATEAKAIELLIANLELSQRRVRSKHQQRVDLFMAKAGQAVPAHPQIPSDEVRKLRALLISEEALETIEALGFETYVTYNQGKRTVTLRDCRTPDLEEIADGCADISVVTIGTLTACGISDRALIEEVDRSNLAKFELPACPLHGDKVKHEGDGMYRCTELVQDGLRMVRCRFQTLGPYRNKEGKWVKGPEWKPPDIKRVLAEQTVAECPQSGCQCGLELQSLEQPYPGVLIATVGPSPGIPLVGTPYHDPGWSEEVQVATPRLETASDHVGRWTSGGKTGLCNNCKAPLSDELVRKLFAPEHRKDVFKCPDCLGILNGKEITYA